MSDTRVYVQLTIGLVLHDEPDWSNPEAVAAFKQVALGKMVTYPEVTEVKFYRVRKEGEEAPAPQTADEPPPPSSPLEHEVSRLLETLSEEV